MRYVLRSFYRRDLFFSRNLFVKCAHCFCNSKKEQCRLYFSFRNPCKFAKGIMSCIIFIASNYFLIHFIVITGSSQAILHIIISHHYFYFLINKKLHFRFKLVDLMSNKLLFRVFSIFFDDFSFDFSISRFLINEGLIVLGNLSFLDSRVFLLFAYLLVS